MSWIDTAGLDPATDIPDGTPVNAVLWGQKVTQRFLDLAVRLAYTGPVNLNITAAGWSAGSATPTYQKIGSWVQLGGQIQFSAATAPGSAWNGTAIFDALPLDHRPANYKMFMCASGSQGAQVQVIVYGNGTIQMRNMGVSNLAAGQQFSLDGCAWYAGT